MKLDTRLKIIALAATNFSVVLVNTFLFPIFPQLKSALAINLVELSYLHAVVSFPAAVLAPLGGLLADRWGRKKVIIPSLILYGGGGLIAGLALLGAAKPYYLVLIGRLLQGIGTATPMYLTIALAGDIFQSRERTRAVGFLETANGAGKLLSPVLGGLIGTLAWYAPFFSYMFFILPVVFMLWRYVDEPPARRHPSWQQEIAAIRRLQNRSYLLALGSAFLVIFITIGTMFWVSDLLETRIAAGKLIRGLIIALPVVAMMLSTLVAGWFSARIDLRVMLGAGLLLMAAALYSVPFTVSSPLLWASIVLVGIGAGILLPALDTISTAVSSGNCRAILTNIFGSMRSLGSAAAPYTFASLLGINLWMAFLPVAIVTTVIAAAVFLFVKEEEALPRNLQKEKKP